MLTRLRLILMPICFCMSCNSTDSDPHWIIYGTGKNSLNCLIEGTFINDHDFEFDHVNIEYCYYGTHSGDHGCNISVSYCKPLLDNYMIDFPVLTLRIRVVGDFSEWKKHPVLQLPNESFEGYLEDYSGWPDSNTSDNSSPFMPSQIKLSRIAKGEIRFTSVGSTDGDLAQGAFYLIFENGTTLGGKFEDTIFTSLCIE